MTSAEAKGVLKFEAEHVDGMLTKVRVGEEPSPAQVTRLTEAIEVIADEIGRDRTIQRCIARQLYLLSFHLEGQIRGWESSGRSWSSESQDLLTSLYVAIDRAFGVDQ